MDMASGACLCGLGKYFLSRNVAIGQEADRSRTGGGKAGKPKMGMRMYGQRCLFIHESAGKLGKGAEDLCTDVCICILLA